MSAALDLEPYAENLRRIQAIEQAANLDPGSLLEAMLSGIYLDDADALFEWIADGWTITSDDPAEIRSKLGALTEQWKAEDEAAIREEAFQC